MGRARFTVRERRFSAEMKRWCVSMTAGLYCSQLSIANYKCTSRKRKLILLVVAVIYMFIAALGYYVITDTSYDVTPKDVRRLSILLKSTIITNWNETTYDVDTSSTIPIQNGTVRKYSCDVTTEHQDLLCDVARPNFLSNYKNPCWKESASPVQCIPYFQLIGVDKSGTTDLFYRLVRHPHVEGNQGYIGKETFWWAWKRYGLDLQKTVPRRDFAYYVHFFQEAAATIAGTVDDSGFHDVITGDGSPMDFWDFRGWTDIPQNDGLKDPGILTPHLIHHINPNTKFIVLLRDPIERLYSDYHFLPIKRVRTPETFHRAVSRSFGVLSSCLHGNTLRHCLFDRSLHQQFNKNARLHIGFYIVYLHEWFKVFPRSQFLIIRFEDYINNIPKYINQVYRFLGLAPVSLQETAVLGILSPVRENVTKRKVMARPMLNKTRDILRDIYQPFNEELSKVLKNEEFLWL
ncbi:carbohydrate sulfotransferase 15-like [Ylistrum balloti]|uniref:carbohydrate sulfotransferase 15-like n=1 Tax=Ylistrum balloti TaxID=509963 RepID=UPI002905AA8E|nr:carbohydrate sulfotransferase 15-like [Ylistrum balloti]